MAKKKTTVTKVTEEFNQRLDYPMSLITISWQLHIQNTYGRAAIPLEVLDDEVGFKMQTLFPTGFYMMIMLLFVQLDLSNHSLLNTRMKCEDVSTLVHAVTRLHFIKPL